MKEELNSNPGILFAFSHAGSGAHLSSVFRLYCSLEAGLTVKDVCMRNDLRSMNVDERSAAVINYLVLYSDLTCMLQHNELLIY